MVSFIKKLSFFISILFFIGCNKKISIQEEEKKFSENFLKKRGIHELEWMTEEYPPYNFGDKEGVNQGIAIEYLEAIFKNLKINKLRKDIQLLPWTRG